MTSKNSMIIKINPQKILPAFFPILHFLLYYFLYNTRRIHEEDVWHNTSDFNCHFWNRAITGPTRCHRENLVQIFTHELTHLILAHRFGEHPIPRWLNEGLSMYESYEWRPSQDVLMGRYVLTGRLIPLRELTRAFQADAFGARQAYLQSYSLVNHIISDYGREAFHQLIRRLSRGEPFAQGVERALGISPEELEARWIRHLKLRYNWLPFLTSSGLLWLLITLGVIFAYAHRKRRARKILDQWAEEEAIAYGPDRKDWP